MANVVDAMTARLLADAGISEGMRVLDVGCGPGDVTRMAARLAGASGRVVGLDRNPSMLRLAEQRVLEANLSNVFFREGDLEGMEQGEEFDAVVGRRVLLYQPDPVGAVRGLLRALRPGGLAVFQEHDAAPVPEWRKPLPLHQRVHGWMWEMLRREGANMHMGYDLPRVLAEAGLLLEHVRAEGIVQTPEIAYPTHEIVRAVLPRIVKEGIASEEEVDAATLGERLRAERAAAKATYVGETVFGAWGRKLLEG